MKKLCTGVLSLLLLVALASSSGLEAQESSLAAPPPPTTTVFLPLMLNHFPRHTYIPVVMRTYTPQTSVFGVHMADITDEGGLRQAVDARVRWTHTVALYWDKIEPVRTNPPTYKWSAVDETSLRGAAENGMTLVAGVHSTPSWAQALPGVYCGPIKPEAYGAFAEFLQRIVARYSQPPYNVHYWELGNEPDVDPSLVDPHSVFGCWGNLQDDYYGGGTYADMLKVAYPTIKAVDPKAQVAVGGLLLNCDPNNVQCPADIRKASRFLEGILRNGGGAYFDTVAFHAYTYYGGQLGKMGNGNWPGSVTSLPEKTAFIRQVLEQYGAGDKEVLNTETAMVCGSANPTCFETQAYFAPRAFAESLALGLQTLLYYELVTDSWRYTGLLLTDLTPKPVYFAYQTSASMLTGAIYDGTASGYPGGIAGYTFRYKGSTRLTDVIWSSDGSPRGVTLPPGALAYDRYGTLLTPPIQVDASVVYVVYNAQ